MERSRVFPSHFNTSAQEFPLDIASQMCRGVPKLADYKHVGRKHVKQRVGAFLRHFSSKDVERAGVSPSRLMTSAQELPLVIASQACRGLP